MNETVVRNRTDGKTVIALDRDLMPAGLDLAGKKLGVDRVKSQCRDAGLCYSGGERTETPAFPLRLFLEGAGSYPCRS